MPPDPYINYTGTSSFPIKAATKIRKTVESTPLLTVTNAYKLVFPENALRKGFAIESAVSNTTKVYVRYGTTGPEWELSGGGSFGRDVKTGSVFTGELYMKGASGGEAFIAEEY